MKFEVKEERRKTESLNFPVVLVLYGAFMDPLDVWLRAWVLALASALFVVSLLAYRRERDRRMLVAVGLFAVFIAKGVLLMLGMFSWSVEEAVSLPWFDRVFDVVVLLFVILYVWHVPVSRRGPED